MRTRTPWMMGACAILCLFAGSASAPVTRTKPPHPTTRHTVEPTLPVDLDMQFLSVTEMDRGGTARLRVSVTASTKVPDLSVDLQLPEGLSVTDGTPTRGWKTGLEAGEQKFYEIPLAAGDRGEFPIRAEASYRLADGRSFHAGQGATLRLGSPLPEGRVNAGAYEFQAVPLQDLHR